MNTVAIYLKYRKERERIKSRKRAELEAELLPLKLQLGEAFMFEQDNNRLKIDDIMALIGTKNRRLFYEMTRLYKAAQGAKESEPEPIESVPDMGEDIQWMGDDTHANVWWVLVNHSGEVVDEYEIFQNDDGSVLLPDEWATHNKDRRALYAKFIKAVAT